MSARQPRDRKQDRNPDRKLRTARIDLAAREVDLASYDRVIADMTRRQLSPFSGAQAIAIVTICRDAIQHDCDLLRAMVQDLERTAP